MHVARAVDVNQRSDSRNHEEHSPIERVNMEAERDGQRGPWNGHPCNCIGFNEVTWTAAYPTNDCNRSDKGTNDTENSNTRGQSFAEFRPYGPIDNGTNKRDERY